MRLLPERRQASNDRVPRIGHCGERGAGLEAGDQGERRRRQSVHLAPEGGPECDGGQVHIARRLLELAVGLGPGDFGPQLIGAGDLARGLQPVGIVQMPVERLERLASDLQHVGGQPALEVAVHQLRGSPGSAPRRSCSAAVTAGLGGAVGGEDPAAREYGPARGQAGAVRDRSPGPSR